MTRVIISAATPALRAGLRAMLEGSALRVLGEAESVSQLGLQPGDADILLIAGDRTSEELEEFLRLDMDIALALMSDELSLIETFRSAGIHGWALISPDATSAQLAAAVTAAAEGLAVVSAHPAQLPYQASPTNTSQTQGDEVIPEPLTPREQEVLQLLSEGLPNKLIAKRLRISEHTVKFHVSSTFAKLGASSRTEAVSLAARRGLISL